MMPLDVFLLAGLLKGSRSFDQNVCAGIWTAYYFVSGLMSSDGFLWTVLFSTVTFGVAWLMFKFERVNDFCSLQWIASVAVGSFLLLFVL